MISVDYPTETGNPKAEEFSHQRPKKKFTINLWKKIFNEFKKLIICNFLISSRLPGKYSSWGNKITWKYSICWISSRLSGMNNVGVPQDYLEVFNMLDFLKITWARDLKNSGKYD